MKILEYGYADIYSAYSISRPVNLNSSSLINSKLYPGYQLTPRVLVARINDDIFIPLNKREQIDKRLASNPDTVMKFRTNSMFNKPFEDLILSKITVFDGEQYIKHFKPLAKNTVLSEEEFSDIVNFEDMLISHNLLSSPAQTAELKR